MNNHEHVKVKVKVNENDKANHNLRYIRHSLNLSLQELGEKVGVTRQCVYVWEAGIRPISKKRLEMLERISGVPKEYFTKHNLTDMDYTEIEKHIFEKKLEDMLLMIEEYIKKYLK